jgi:hypothetical protein
VFAPSADPSMLAAAFLLPLEVKKNGREKTPSRFNRRNVLHSFNQRSYFSPALPPLKSED